MAKKILVIDDEFEDLSIMKTVLEKNKYDVSTATNGAQAIDLIDGKRWDLFIIDIKMPTLSGYDLLRLLKERTNGNSKMIFVSIIPKSEANLDEVDGFVQKPFKPQDLLKEVKKVLRG